MLFIALAVHRTLLGNLFFPKYGTLAHEIIWLKKTPKPPPHNISSISVPLEREEKKKKGNTGFLTCWRTGRTNLFIKERAELGKMWYFRLIFIIVYILLDLSQCCLGEKGGEKTESGFTFSFCSFICLVMKVPYWEHSFTSSLLTTAFLTSTDILFCSNFSSISIQQAVLIYVCVCARSYKQMHSLLSVIASVVSKLAETQACC